MALLQNAGKAGGNRHHRGHRAQPQSADRLICRTLQRLSKQLLLMQHTLSGNEDLLTLGRKALESPAPFDNGRAKLFFQRPNRIGQSGLCDVAGIGSAPKVFLLMKSHQIAK